MVRRNLPSLNALRAFEAFSRHGRMSLAADELCVTHGAVSRHIRRLETDLGVRLVDGPKTALRLTGEGARLAASLTGGFDQMAAAVAVAQAEAPTALEVSCVGTLAMRWLIPRLPGFIARHPNIRVGLSESYAHVDFRRDGVDLAIRMSEDLASEDAEKTPIMDHYNGPVAAPSLVTDGPFTLDRLAALPRLHTRTFRRGWSEWESLSGHRLGPAPVDREFDHHFYMLEAAAAGLGVAIGPWPSILEDLATGRLIAPFGFVPARARYVTLRPKDTPNAAAEAFRDWLVEEGAATPPPPVVHRSIPAKAPISGDPIPPQGPGP
ncbi:MAG TPA: LysR substrate-binding domain-containing protein [Caulobacteraceae bacterium]|jgi:DNA-binding transcriptional LysR family regulator|nr:LysR substrate-binding domain-containing protein [Caulobacteraceae bacterium]